ncbi:MAG: hypothetical protein Unbinned80contig1000_19 [Prokaryotic dsDNA virus sp.]|nr:MAG: hypothetical protein Unbinned80contig1000_19 [Prokaryotic dsDNA virus sp.]|tara:strand:- start:11241 stop:11396 length:156 start_codon:yes stop_codon:yes gene_type:complete
MNPMVIVKGAKKIKDMMEKKKKNKEEKKEDSSVKISDTSGDFEKSEKSYGG